MIDPLPIWPLSTGGAPGVNGPLDGIQGLQWLWNCSDGSAGHRFWWSCKVLSLVGWTPSLLVKSPFLPVQQWNHPTLGVSNGPMLRSHQPRAPLSNCFLRPRDLATLRRRPEHQHQLGTIPRNESIYLVSFRRYVEEFGSIRCGSLQSNPCKKCHIISAQTVGHPETESKCRLQYSGPVVQHLHIQPCLQLTSLPIFFSKISS